MAKLDQTTQLDITNKMSLGVVSTTNDRNYFEEAFAWSPQLIGSDIYSETVPTAADPTAADNAVSANPTILEKLTDYFIDELPGSNGEGYSAYATPGNTTTTRLVDWLTPQKFGNGYAVTLKQQDDTPIALTDGAFQVDYRNGIIRFDPNFRPADLGYSLPLKLTTYRYIGAKVTKRETLEVEAFTVAGPAETQFILAQTPIDVTKLFLLGNGIAYSQLAGHVSVVGTTVTWLALEFPSFDPSDEVVITYTV